MEYVVEFDMDTGISGIHRVIKSPTKKLLSCYLGFLPLKSYLKGKKVWSGR